MSDMRSPDDVFNRPPRIYRRWRTESVELPEPPAPPKRDGGSGWLTYGMPMLSAVVMVVAYAAIGQGAGGYGLLFGIPMVIMAVMGIVTTLANNRAQKKRDEAEFAQRQAF